MTIEKMGIRWGTKNKKLNRKEKDLLSVLIASNESLRDEVFSLSEEGRALSRALSAFSQSQDHTDLYVPSREARR